MTTSSLPSHPAEERRARDDYEGPLGRLGRSKEESRSFLRLSRENLSISRSDLEDGFKEEQRFRPRRHVLVGLAALSVALLCIGLEAWQVRSTLLNSRRIEELGRDVENLKHRFLEQRLLDELKAFEEQLEYDSDYDDVSEEVEEDDEDVDLSIAAVDSKEPTAVYANSESSDSVVDATSETPETSETSEDVELERTLEESPAVSAKIEDGPGKERNVAKRRREVLSNAHRKGTNGDTKEEVKNDAVALHGDHSSLSTREGRPPKKYGYTGRQRTDPSEIDESKKSRRTERNGTRSAKSAEFEIAAEPNVTRGEGEREGEMLEARDALEGDRHSNFDVRDVRRRKRRPTKRHLRAPRQVYAVHYGADSSLFTEEDEHLGNGKARHGEGIFKAWRASEWVDDLGMARYFTMASDGRLTVHETGLYLAYAQIHYLDEHDENGFHLLVNGKPLLQCMVYSPGTGHKSRSCFSAQVTVLRPGDRLVLKDVGAARYTLFQRDKSFFGLVKLGELRQQQQQQQQRHQLPALSTERSRDRI